MKKRSRRKARLETLLNGVGTPVFLLDAARRVLFFNAGCETLTGWPADDVVGQVCDYVTEADPQQVESVTGSLCPPPEVFSGSPTSVPAYLTLRNGRSAARLLNFYPLVGAAGEVETVLGVIAPIEQPKQHTETTPAQQLHAELAALRISLRQRYGLKLLVCHSAAMRRVLEQIRLAVASASAVLLLGEAGTGKEHIARTIHYESEHRSRAFVPLDCRRLAARELKQTFRRLFEQHDGETPPISSLQPGSLYLSNVECLSRDLQEMLVRRVESPESRVESPDPSRLSGSGFWTFDSGLSVRLMASSTADVAEAVEQEHLREDFYYLLTPLQIALPPLRRRLEDLQPLAQLFLEEGNRGEEQQVGGFTESVWVKFREYNWPGNLDELALVVGEARAACTGTAIQGKDLPFRFRTGLDAQAVGPAVAPRPRPLEPLLKQVEAEQIRLALDESRYNKSKAAELLGITRARLYRRMQALGIEDRDETNGP